ncbi:MAG: chemotaxis protein CheW, partial [Candidatus Omnitrophota bacterium]
KGKILINVFREKGHVLVDIIDDGRGIDYQEIAKKAVEKGLCTEQEVVNMDNKKALDIMTLPGFSTNTEVTEISGRGVGLDIVKVKLISLGGRVDFESEVNKGTKFTLTLPLTLAIIKAMLVEVGSEIFAIPLMNIRESVKITSGEIKTIQGKEVIKVRDEIIPLIRMTDKLNIRDVESSQRSFSVVIVEGGLSRLGLLVNKIIREQDIVVKTLGSLVRKVPGIAGATILGDGRVILILDIVNLK